MDARKSLPGAPGGGRAARALKQRAGPPPPQVAPARRGLRHDARELHGRARPARRRDLRPFQDGRPLQPRPGRGLRRPRPGHARQHPQGGAPARRGQDGHPRFHPEEARTADGAGMGGHPAPSRAGLRPGPRRQARPRGREHHPLPPREVRRHGLSQGPQGRGHPARGAGLRRGRHARRRDLAPPLPGAARLQSRPPRAHGRRRETVRPEDRGRLLRHGPGRLGEDPVRDDPAPAAARRVRAGAADAEGLIRPGTTPNKTGTLYLFYQIDRPEFGDTIPFQKKWVMSHNSDNW
ncbi:MAG: hypothetical protein MZV64_10640 [Ignavibacteriales bacterium]|nr:hypothetical protein [Ignavibacteriales bacterium]